MDSPLRHRCLSAGLPMIVALAILADRPVVARAVQKGARFDNWSDQFDPALWEGAFGENGLCAEGFLKEREDNETLPWDFIDVGVSRSFLLEERRRAYKGEPTPDCRTRCVGCGVLGMLGRDGTCPARQAAVLVPS